MPYISTRYEAITTTLTTYHRPMLYKEEGTISASPLIRESVSELQALLQQKGYDLRQTSLFDAATHLAVLDFQRKRGISEDGVVGQETWANLLVLERPVLRIFDGYDHITPHFRMEVRELQAALVQKGFLAVIDGRFDEATESLVKQFQERMGIEADGIVGRETWAKLFDVVYVSAFLKDHIRVMESDIVPALSIEPNGGWKLARLELAECYNRLGGMIQTLSELLEIPAEVVLTLYFIESGGRSHTPYQATIRFENYLFYQFWGRFNVALYDRHFQHGGHSGVGGQVWQHHRFRERIHEPFTPVHTDQSHEYRVMTLAQRISNDDEMGLLALSMGTLQFFVHTYSMLGYESAKAMYEAFQASETAQLIALFDFCRELKAPDKGALLHFIKQQDWKNFTRIYNGRKFSRRYAEQIAIYLEEAKQLGI